MLRHASISEIYTRGASPSSLPCPFDRERACLPVHNLRHVPSCLVSFVFYRLPLSLFLSRSLSSRQRDWVIPWFVLLITELRGTRYNGSVESTRVEWTSGTPDITENEGTASPRGKHASAPALCFDLFPSAVRDFTFPHFARHAGRQESIFSSLSSLDLPPYFFLTPASYYCCHRCRAGVVFLMEERYRIHLLREMYLSLPPACM